MSIQPNDSPQSNDDKADDYLTYNEVRTNVFTTVHHLTSILNHLPLISGVRPHLIIGLVNFVRG